MKKLLWCRSFRRSYRIGELALAIAFTTGTASAAESAFQFSDTSIYPTNRYPVPLLVTSPVSFQGLTVSATFDPAIIEIPEISFDPLGSEAEYTKAEVFPAEGRFAIEIVADAVEPFDGQELPGSDQPQCMATLMVEIAGPGPVTTTQLRFVDGLGDPPVNNRIALSTGPSVPDLLIDATLTVQRFPPSFEFDDTLLFSGEILSVPLYAQIGCPFQGYSVSATYDPTAIEITEITFEGGAEVPEILRTEILPAEGRFTIEVLTDSTAPYAWEFMGGAWIAWVSVKATEGPGPETATLRFVDGLGDPPVDNRFFVDGSLLVPDSYREGTITISRTPVAYGIPDATVTVSPATQVPFQVTTGIPYQGLAASVKYDQEVIEVTEISFAGTAAEDVGAEYVDAKIFPAEGRFQLGILVDGLPPFDGRLLPASEVPLTLAWISVAAVDREGPNTTEMRFVDGLGSPPINNLISVSNRPKGADVFDDATITVLRVPYFLRGDANGQGRVDISDPIYLIAFLFMAGKPIKCLDAADANDDERIDVSDAIFLLSYMFQAGRKPGAPFPGAGPDPTPGGILDIGCADSPFPGGPPY
jgi:hypothetical protein